MIDIHTHIIPDVDDGAIDFPTSLLLIEDAKKQGITSIFATSHITAFIDEADARTTKEKFHDLKQIALSKHNIKLYLGCEIICTKNWMERILQGLERKQYPSLNDTRYVLIEFSTIDINMEQVYYCTDRLLSNGWIPVFAHIERYAHVIDSSFIAHYKEQGCLFQMNYYSLFEEEDPVIVSFAKEMIALEYIDFLGSDMHNIHHRPPMICNGIQYLKKHCNEEYLQRILYDNAVEYLNIER